MLKQCSECFKEISSTSRICPHCGYRKRNKSPVFSIIGILLLLVIPFIGMEFLFLGSLIVILFSILSIFTNEKYLAIPIILIILVVFGYIFAFAAISTILT